jgi:hypothetical protein
MDADLLTRLALWKQWTEVSLKEIRR